MRSLAHIALAAALVACGGTQEPEGTVSSDPLDSVSGDELFERGQTLVRAGDFVRAEQYFAAAMRRGKPETEVLPALLHACVRGDRLVAALSYAEPFLAQHPSEWSLRLLVASIHMGLEHHAEAIAHLQRVLADAPEEPPQAHYFLGVLYRDRLDDRESAERHFARYVALAPDGPHAEEAAAGVPDSALRMPVRVDQNGEPLEQAASEEGPAEPVNEPEPAEETSAE